MYRAGLLINGRSVADPYGDGSRTIPSRTSSITARVIQDHGIRTFGRATTSGPADIFARDADTGEARWFYQWTPHDVHDWDGINEQILLDSQRQWQQRKVLTRAERNGYVYVMDRLNGEVLSATAIYPYHDKQGSRPQDRPAARPSRRRHREQDEWCVTSVRSRQAQRIGSRTHSRLRPGFLYIPHNNMCEDMEGTEVSYIAGTPYVGAHVRMYAGPGGHRGEFTAWDPVAAKPAFKIKERFPVWSGTVATAGDVDVLRHYGRLVQSRSRSHGPDSLAAQGRIATSSASLLHTEVRTVNNM